MKIYLDLILLLNFFIDFLLLLTVSIILKRNANIKKIIFGSFVGGLSIIFLFLNFNSFILFIFKLFIAILMILITFEYKNIKYTLINLFYLYITSIVLGGFLYLINIDFSYKHIGIIFFNNGISINFVFLLIFSPIILYIYTKQTKKLKYNYSNYYNIDINYNNNIYKYVGYMDTGNILVDSLTNKIVILISEKSINFKINNYRFIYYKSIDKENILKVIKINYLLFNNKKYNNILLGIIDNIDMDGIDVLLNRKLLEE